MAADSEAAIVIQAILKTSVQDTNKIEDILAAANALVRADVIDQFRTNEELRVLFPEYEAYFDNRLMN
jgi:hypothetical protein